MSFGVRKSHRTRRFRSLAPGKGPRALVTLILAIGISAMSVPAAWAAPPTNDLFAGATPVFVGFSEALDTTEATTDADDASMNATCGAPATDASVWYSLTAVADGGVVVDVSASSYTAGVLVATGAPGSFSLITCGPGSVAFPVVAGTTYYILAIDDQFDGGGNGGTLRISVGEAPPPPTVEITVDPTGTFNKATGGATLTGTLTCANADFVDVFGELVQQVGRFAVRGTFSFFSSGECDGTAHQWIADVLPEPGTRFAGGKSASVTFAFACGTIMCAFDYTEQRVQLRGGK